MARKRTKRSAEIVVLENRLIKARTIHQLRCGCVLDKGVWYHKIKAIYDGVKQTYKGHAGPCPKSGVVCH